MEEIDLCWRIQQTGLKIFYTGSSHVYHVGGGTLAKSNPRKTYFNFRNGLGLLVKNLPTTQLFWKIPLRLMLDWVAGAKFLLTGSPTNAWAVVKAHGSFLKNLGRDYSKRSLPTQAPIGTIHKGLLLIDYYLKGKRNFSDLGNQ
ncbi:MAG TPA: hypothetical protein PLJ08_23070 [Cyclobacteriaceae bacterium]|nr:hypothetical protein [Cyclobacteriaceae bacterium]